MKASAEAASGAAQSIVERRPVEAALRSCRQGLIGIGVFSCIMNVLLLTGPFFMLQIYDRVLTSRSVATLVALALLAVVLYLFYGVFEWIRSRLLTRLGQAFDDDLAEIAFDNTATQRTAGASAAGDLKAVQQFVSSPALATLFDVPWFPFYLAIIFLLHPILGLLGLFGAALLIGIAIVSQAISHRRNLQAAEHASTEDLLMRASRQQVEPLQAMGMLGNVQRLWRGAHDRRVVVQTSASDWQSMFSSAAKTLRLILQSAVLGLGAYLVIANELSPGALIAASIIFARALAPIDQSIAQWRVITNAHQAYNRLKETLSVTPGAPETSVLALPKETLTVNSLSVASPDGETMLMDETSFTLKAGDGLGIIGPSGGGKSTLIRGLLGLAPVLSGEVRLDGATLDQWSKKQQGQFIGYLPQDIDLFPGTIAQNIARFDPDADGESIVNAAKLAMVHDLITQKPGGYEMLIGPGGISLSGGERQRIALARAVYGSPFFVILDEPNSNMDAIGERALARTIRQLRASGSIVIVVTHRATLLGDVNKLLQVANNRPVIFGDTKTVLERLRDKHQQTAEKTGELREVN